MNFEEVGPKLLAVVRKLDAVHGPVQLFGLLMPANRSTLFGWDVVVAAPWLKPGILESYGKIDECLREFLTDNERRQFARIVVLTRAEDALQEFIDRFDGTPGLYHFRFETAGGAAIRKAYIVEANGFGPRRDPVPRPRRKTLQAAAPAGTP